MMSTKNKRLLEKKCPVLMEAVDLQSSRLLAILVAEQAITNAQRGFIKHQVGNSQQVETLVEILLRKTDNTVDILLDALEESGHSDVAKDLRHSREAEVLDTPRGMTSSQQGPTAQELQQALRRNIEQYIKTDPSRILEETESTVYVHQSVTVQKVHREKEPEKMSIRNVSELLETCNSPGQRVFVYGMAGMGKSSLCRNIAQIWAGGQSKLCQQFDYVFPIPMRSVRSYSLIDIICRDVKLIPESCKQRIEQELDLKHILFILDSYEELSHPTPEINKLIRRELCANSSVLVTARPGLRLEDEENESKPCIRARLEDLTEEQVKDYMANFPGLQEDVQLQIEKKFGMRFLIRPINLWLICLLLAWIPSSAGVPDTQTVLLNMIIQHLMLAYSMKKHLSDSSMKPESPYKKRWVLDVTLESPMKSAPTTVKVMLKEVGQLCYFGLRDRKRVLTIDDDVLSKADVMAMGLFSEGADDNSVTLPHPLFQEYLAALFLSVDRRARQDLLKELREESEGSSPRPYLVTLLQSRGFDNMVRFLVGLSGVPERLTDLFCFWHNAILNEPLNFTYELDLLKECRAEEGKSQIASALLKAPVMDSDIQYEPETATDSHLLLHHFDEEQRQVFLRKFYGCQICSKELSSDTAQDRRHCCLDSFVVGMIYLHNCTVRLKRVKVECCHVPFSMLTDRLAAVEYLTLSKSTLCNLTGSQFLASLNLTSLSHSLTPDGRGQSEVSLNCLNLEDVRGLSLLSQQHCTLPTMGHLVVSHCEDVNLGPLRQCFTGVSELALQSIKHVITYDGQWSSVCKLKVSFCEDVNLRSLHQCFTGVSELALKSIKHVSNDDGQWPSVRKLEVFFCEDANLRSLHQCFTGVSELTLGSGTHLYTYDCQWSSVSKLKVSCKNVNLGPLSKCYTGVSELTLLQTNHVKTYDGQWSSVCKLNVLDCEDVNLVSLCQCFTGVSELTLMSIKHGCNYDGHWPSVSKLVVFDCEDINLRSLHQCFTGVSELTLLHNKHVNTYDVQWPSVSKLKVSSLEDVNLRSLCQCFTEVGELTLEFIKHVHNFDGQWPSVSKLLVFDSEDINLRSLHQCFTGVSELSLFQNKHLNTNDGQWSSVCKLEVFFCEDVNLRSLHQCFTGVSELTLGPSKHLYTYDCQWSSVSKLTVIYVDVNLGPLSKCFTGVSELTLIQNKHVITYDGQWSSVCKLEVVGNENVNLGSLCQCFTGVNHLTLTFNKDLNYDGKWSSVRKLQFDMTKSNVKIDLLSLKETFIQLEELDVKKLLGIKKTVPDRQTQWQTVKSLKFIGSELHSGERILSEEEAREFLTQFCPQAGIILQMYGFRIDIPLL